MTEEEKKNLPHINEVAFWMHSNASLNIKSCTFYHFDNFVYAEDFGSITIEKSSFIDSRGHSINMVNPLIVNVLENQFENMQKSSISLKFLRHAQSHKIIASSTSGSLDSSSIISIKGNTMVKGGSYGVSIFGEDPRLKDVSISISRNKFDRLKKDAIGIKFLNYNYLKLSGNQITNLKGNGIYLMSI